MGSPPRKRARIQALAAAARGAKQTTETSAQEAITLSFFLPSSISEEKNEQDLIPFHSHPLFTHQIFDKELIRGYRNPRITLSYDARSLASGLGFEWDWRVKDEDMEVLVGDNTDDDDRTGDDEEEDSGDRDKKVGKGSGDGGVVFLRVAQRGGITDVLGRLRRFRTAGCVKNLDELRKRLRETWKLPVQENAMLREYRGKNGKMYRVFRERLAGNERLKEFHRRLQFLMFVHIDGASFIDEQDERWELFLIFGRQNEFVAYSTVYPFLAPAKGSLKEGFRDRVRISQVFVLPPFQGQGHGRALLSAIYDDAKKRNAMEITVEDPSEGFRRLRDGLDLSLCYKKGILPDDTAMISVDGINEQAIIRMRKELLLTASQARRIMEIHCCRAVPWPALNGDYDESDQVWEQMKRFRLMVKRRLYREYEEVLSVYDRDEKKEKLKEIYSDYESAYRKVAERLNGNTGKRLNVSRV